MFRCETCGGSGVIPMIRIGLRVAKPEHTCSTCLGRGLVCAGHALLLCIESCGAHMRYSLMVGEPAYLAQARAKNDERILGFWSRLCGVIERADRMREAWKRYEETGVLA